LLVRHEKERKKRLSVIKIQRVMITLEFYDILFLIGFAVLNTIAFICIDEYFKRKKRIR